MPPLDRIRYYFRFLRDIPVYGVGYIRVTHPFAGRRQVLLLAMPLGLHVLGLPLAFILSQDQTLHCNYYLLLFVLILLKELLYRHSAYRLGSHLNSACLFFNH